MNKTKNRWLLRCVAGATLCVSALSGCQTYFGGMTLPSPHYLQHYPTYFPPDPPFTHQRERDSMLDPTGEIRRGINVGGGGGVPGALPAPGAVQPPVPVPPGLPK